MRRQNSKGENTGELNQSQRPNLICREKKGTLPISGNALHQGLQFLCPNLTQPISKVTFNVKLNTEAMKI